MLGRAIAGRPRESDVRGRRRRSRLLRRRAQRRQGLSRASPIPLCAARTGTPTTCGWRPSAASSAAASTASTCCCCTTPTAPATRREAVWTGMAALRDAGLTRMIGVAPGPANGFTLDLIDCLERFGALLDWAMIILNPLEPWPGELVLGAAAQADVRLITRVVDYGGLFFDDLHPGQELARGDHRGFRPAGWIESGRERLEAMRPIAQRAGLTTIQLACQWNLAHAPVACVAPTLIQEVGPQARSLEDKRAELAALPRELRLSDGRRGRDPPAGRQHRFDGAQGRQPRATPATSSPTAGRWMRSWRTSRSAGGSSPSATSPNGPRASHERVPGHRDAATAARSSSRSPSRSPAPPTATAPAASAAPAPLPRPTRAPPPAAFASLGAKIGCAPGSRRPAPRSSSAATAARTVQPHRRTGTVGVRLGVLDSDPGIRPSCASVHRLRGRAGSRSPTTGCRAIRRARRLS